MQRSRMPYQVTESFKITSSSAFGKKNGPVACIHCGQTATKEAYFKQYGVTVIERYCNSCMEPPTFSRLQEFYSRFA